MRSRATAIPSRHGRPAEPAQGDPTPRQPRLRARRPLEARRQDEQARPAARDPATGPRPLLQSWLHARALPPGRHQQGAEQINLTVKIHEESGVYWSEIRELPGCFASGRTLDELREAIEDNVRLYLDDPALTLALPALHVGDVTATAEPGTGSALA